jgi:hypothetical protein
MSRLLIASPHRYPDLARLWHRFVMRELVPAFERIHLVVEVNIFCDANADQFLPHRFPGVRFTRSGPGMRDFMEFYDATLNAPCDFLLFLDADTFLLDGDWAGSYFKVFENPRVVAVSFVPRKGAPAIFALLCRVESYRALPPPALACRYEFPADWPHGVNLQPGDFAARELAKRGKTVINIGPEESAQHAANFRGTTGLRASREHITRASGEQAFFESLAENPVYLVAAYDNVLLGCLYESLYHEPFAPDSAGRALGASLTVADLRQALEKVRDIKQLASLRERFQQSERNIQRMAAREGVRLLIPPVLPDGKAGFSLPGDTGPIE